MLELFSFICVVIALCAFLHYRFALNPVSSMFFLWAVIVPLSGVGFYGTLIPQTRTYTVIAVGLAAYLLGVLIGSKRYRIVSGVKGTNVQTAACAINYWFLYALMLISLVYYLIQSVHVVRLLSSGSTFADIRMMVASDEENALNGSRVLSAIRAFIAVPTTYLVIAILPIELFFGKRKKALLFGAIAIMLLFVFTNGARSVIVWIAIYFLVVFSFFRRAHKIRIRIKRKYRFRLIVGGTFLLVLMFYMTVFRKGPDVDFRKQLFLYFIAPVPHFDHYVDVVNSSNVYGFGFSSFYGVIYPLLYVMRIVTGSYPEFITRIYYMSFEMMEPGFNLGNGVYMNAFVTAFYQPYLDGRYWGVILIMALFGFVCSQTFERSRYNQDLKAMLIYSLLLQKILFSFVRFYFTQQAQAMCFIFALLAIRRIYTNKVLKGSAHGFCNYPDVQQRKSNQRVC